MFKKILIANRGEIALRVLRAAKELGVQVVVAYSQADENSLPALLADESICIGPAPAKGSYMNIRNLLSAAILTGTEAVHPGYGFLSENSEFAQKCEEHNLIFIGPRPQNISQIGDKASARAIAVEAGVPVTPGSSPFSRIEDAHDMANAIGYPIMLKASAGGGGRGMRIVRTPDQLQVNIQNAQEEARISFGNSEIYMERFLENLKHVEIQIFGDGKGEVLHFYDRDCSIQRRYQKIIEEAPSIGSLEVREAMAQAAVRLAKHIKYRGAGTCEFLVDGNGRFYFSEMNTRIQVEHPVTEMITGFDLVQEQFRVAAGLGLSISQKNINPVGHAIEVRINAEDPSKSFRPCPGKITDLHWPGGPGIRVDSHAYAGYSIPPNYDSLIAKVIAWAPTRGQAIARMRRALKETVIEGVETSIPFHLKVIDNEYFQRGEINTDFIERRME
ncbi:MAG: acetyl-CoA carboxylase biotin carboxylase subunit [Trueperaceae bacterium]|jgi:acetyl-CoA carboxylase biotin carboxylase subunit|nr:acetyl-CoA carboxylase biotin carboxylase subunit [Trueperaceae bacterium]|tara:strand:+ start:2949 stop:4283 length:1335 start_codon:yes stop_codon:yes gene_type:complete